jgi:hypothetical protein
MQIIGLIFLTITISACSGRQSQKIENKMEKIDISNLSKVSGMLDETKFWN